MSSSLVRAGSPPVGAGGAGSWGWAHVGLLLLPQSAIRAPRRATLQCTEFA